jgi:hypothetical protein
MLEHTMPMSTRNAGGWGIRMWAFLDPPTMTARDLRDEMKVSRFGHPVNQNFASP